MKRETILDAEMKKFVHTAIEQYKAGDSVHDVFLEELCNEMRGGSYGIKIPGVIYPSDKKYNFVENYRVIVDADCEDNAVFVYFDHPISESPVYLGTFTEDIKRQLWTTIPKLTQDFRTTPFDQSPFTVKIDMKSYPNPPKTEFYWDNVQTLRYYAPPVFLSEFLFDVVDFGGLSSQFLKSIR
jgi:hypothetical protein